MASRIAVTKLGRFLLAVAVVGVASCGCSHKAEAAPCDSSEEATRPWPLSPASEGVLHVVTWNLHGIPLSHAKSQRLGRVAKVLLERAPDLILFQEVWLERDARSLTSGLESKYMRVTDDAAIARGGRKWLGVRKGGLLAFRKEMSPWEAGPPSFLQFKARATWLLFWQADGMAGKGIQRFRVEGLGRKMVVLNTHLQSPYHRDACPLLECPYDAVRSKQIGELTTYVGESENRGATVVAMGDFNTTPDTYNKDEMLYGEMTRTWKDLTEKYRQAYGSGPIMNKKAQLSDWIDYILWRTMPGSAVSLKRMRLICNVAADDPYSDHHGLEAQLLIPPPDR
jgi:endonuclease/exonuclease/phosphatase family metal-dependent hydrolase